jgi:hypothetical protein
MQTKGVLRVSWLREHLDRRGLADENLDTFLEGKALKWIRASGLPEPVAQASVIANGSRYEPDLSYPNWKISIEPDGPHHLIPWVAERDRRRNADFAISGWIGIHIGLETPIDEFIAQLRTAIDLRRTATA